MKLTVETRSLDDIRPYGNNSKRHDEESVKLIAASIERFGFNDPIAVDEDGEIIEGHGRFEAAKHLGMETVPVIVLEGLSDEKKRLYRIAHNKIALSSTFDFARLADALSELVGEDIEYVHLGFAETVADNLMRDIFKDEMQRPVSVAPIEPFEIVWDTKEQATRWRRFVKQTHSLYPNMTDAEVLDEFIRDCGILEGENRINGSADNGEGEQEIEA